MDDAEFDRAVDHVESFAGRRDALRSLSAAGMALPIGQAPSQTGMRSGAGTRANA